MKKSQGWTFIKVYTIFIYIWMFTPIVAVVILSFNPQQFASFPMDSLSFKWYVKLANNITILGAFKNSLILGFLTAILTTIIGIPVGVVCWAASALIYGISSWSDSEITKSTRDTSFELIVSMFKVTSWDYEYIYNSYDLTLTKIENQLKK